MASRRSCGQPLITPRLCRSRYQISMVARRSITTIKNPACYDLDPYIGKYCEYTSIDEPDKPFTYAGHIERDSRGEAMVHDSGEDWVYAYTGVISEIKIYM